MNSIFLGKHKTKLIDNRVILPSYFFDKLKKETVVIEKDPYEKNLNIYPYPVWEERIRFIKSRLNPTDPRQSRLLDRFYQNFYDIKLNDSFIKIPESFLGSIGILSNDLYLIGRHEIIQLWGIKEFDSIFESNTIQETEEINNRFSHLTNEIDTTIVKINNIIIQKIISDPDEIYRLDPRKFEEFMADLFSLEGYTVHLTPQTRDFGIDILAYKKNSFTDELIAIECKRYNPLHKVGRPIVQKLHSIVEFKKYTGGIIATTSMYTKDAKNFASEIGPRIKLIDFFDIQKNLARHKDIFSNF